MGVWDAIKVCVRQAITVRQVLKRQRGHNPAHISLQQLCAVCCCRDEVLEVGFENLEGLQQELWNLETWNLEDGI